MKRRTAREKALQALFQIDLAKSDANESYQYVLNGAKEDEYLKQLVFGTVKHLNEIDEIIKSNLENWTLERLGNVDRNILRLAVFEMKYVEEIPHSVSINEAVEIAKQYGDENSGKFVNGVLSKVKSSL